MSFNRLVKKFAQQMPPDPMGGTGGSPFPVDSAGAGMDPSMDMGDPSMMDPAMADPTGAQQPPADPSQGQQKFTLGSLTSYIESDPDSAMDYLKSQISEDTEVDTGEKNPDGTPKTIQAWSLLEPENWRTANDETKGKVAGLIQKALPSELKVEEMGTDDSNAVPGVEKTVDIKASVEASNAAIKAYAMKLASARPQVKQAFNLSRTKTAAGLVQEVYPVLDGHTTVDLRTHQLINNKDIVERNKSYGLWPTDLFSRLGIDYDGFWQTHIMDKYYREYRDKDGNWVGGYIRKRFEVDSNVPEMNNMQYAPGEKRKPARAMLLEGRLEENRGGKAFNWVKAKSNGPVKTAQHDNSFETEKFDFNRGKQTADQKSDAEIQYALDDLKETIDIQEQSRRGGGNTPKLGYYWDEYHTLVGEKARRIKSGNWNPSPNAQATDSNLPTKTDPIVGETSPTPMSGAGQPPVVASTKLAKACKQCGTAMLKGTEGNKCPACCKANADEETREAALKKK